MNPLLWRIKSSIIELFQKETAMKSTKQIHAELYEVRQQITLLEVRFGELQQELHAAQRAQLEATQRAEVIKLVNSMPRAQLEALLKGVL